MRYALATFVLIASAAPSSATPTVKQMMAAWDKAGENCSGSTQDEQFRSDECARQAALRAHLNDAGWCYGREGEAQYQKRWHQCGPRSIMLNDLKPYSSD